MAINFRSNTIIKNLRVGPLSGGGNGGGGGSSEPSYLAVGAFGVNSYAGAAYIYDATNYSATPTKLAPTGLDASDRFGESIAVNGNQIIVGTYSDEDQVTDTGAVYIYDVTNLSATPTKLAPSSLSTDDRFGASIAASQNYILVGAFNDDDTAANAGAVYVYDATNLSATPTKLTAFDGGTNHYFGSSISLNSTNMVVGANKGNNNIGAAYVYNLSNLSTTPTKLVPPDGSSNDNFGKQVAFTDTHLAISSIIHNSEEGAVYVYDSGNFSSSPIKVAPSDLEGGDQFGNSIAISDSLLVVASKNKYVNGTPNSGAVYIYDINNLSNSPTKLTAFDSPGEENFGYSVSILGNSIVVGAIQDNDQGSRAGAVYVYDATNLSATPTKLTAFDGAASARFGNSVSLG